MNGKENYYRKLYNNELFWDKVKMFNKIMHFMVPGFHLQMCKKRFLGWRNLSIEKKLIKDFKWRSKWGENSAKKSQFNEQKNQSIFSPKVSIFFTLTSRCGVKNFDDVIIHSKNVMKKVCKIYSNKFFWRNFGVSLSEREDFLKATW